MLEHVVVAAVTLDPALPFESRRNFCPLRFGWATASALNAQILAHF
jgi:hypothetical protein